MEFKNKNNLNLIVLDKETDYSNYNKSLNDVIYENYKYYYEKLVKTEIIFTKNTFFQILNSNNRIKNKEISLQKEDEKIVNDLNRIKNDVIYWILYHYPVLTIKFFGVFNKKISLEELEKKTGCDNIFEKIIDNFFKNDTFQCDDTELNDYLELNGFKKIQME